MALDQESRKYLHVTLKQISFNYSSGEEVKTVKNAKVGKCEESFFKTDYEKKFYQKNKNNNLHCCMDNEVYAQGTRDSAV